MFGINQIRLVIFRFFGDELCLVKMGNYLYVFDRYISYPSIYLTIQAFCAYTSGVTKNFQVNGCTRAPTEKSTSDGRGTTCVGKRHPVLSTV